MSRTVSNPSDCFVQGPVRQVQSLTAFALWKPLDGSQSKQYHALALNLQ